MKRRGRVNVHRSSSRGSGGFLRLLLAITGLVLGAARLLPGLESRGAVACGALISAGVFSFSFVLYQRGVRSGGQGRFIKLVVGAIIARMLSALGLLAIGAALLGLAAGPLAVSCLGTYLAFSLLEHLYLLPVIKRGSESD